MRGPAQPRFVSLINFETTIADKHPIRAIKRLCDEVLRAMSAHFDEIYAADGAPSIPPETLLEGKVLQSALYRAQRAPTVRPAANQPNVPLVRGSAPGPGGVRRLDLQQEPSAAAPARSREKRRNDTHESTTDPEAKLVRKGPGKEARLCFAGHATMENRHGLCVLFEVHPAVGASESAVAVDQATELRNRGFKPRTQRRRRGLSHGGVCHGHAGAGHRAAPDAQAREKNAARHLHRGARDEPESARAHRGDFRLGKNDRLLPQEPLPRRRVHARRQYVVAWNLVRMAKLLVSGHDARRPRRPRTRQRSPKTRRGTPRTARKTLYQNGRFSAAC
jgi:hypothetical protein